MRRIEVKRGCNLYGLHPKIKEAIYVARDVFWEVAGQPVIITSAWDGRHSRISLHFSGMAVDLRSKHLPTIVMKREVLGMLGDELGVEYDILLESISTPNEHFHVEWDEGKFIREQWIRHVMLDEVIE